MGIPDIEAKVLSEFMGGRVTGHALKHLDAETGDLGPLTVQIRLEDTGGVNSCKAEILVPRSYRHRFPIGAFVRVDLTTTQQELIRCEAQEAAEHDAEKTKRAAAGQS